MNKSNSDAFSLPDDQARWLVQLFAPSFDACLDEAMANTEERPFLWHPVLTDIHQQLVHALPPVWVAFHQRPGETSPTLSLRVLPAFNGAVQSQANQDLWNDPDSLTPSVKPTL